MNGFSVEHCLYLLQKCDVTKISIMNSKTSKEKEMEPGLSDDVDMEGEGIIEGDIPAEGEVNLESPFPKISNKDKTLKISSDKKQGHSRHHRDHTSSERHHHRRHHHSHRRHRRSNSIDDITDEREMTDEGHEQEDQEIHERLHSDSNETADKVRGHSRRHHHSSKIKSNRKSDSSHKSHGSPKEPSEEDSFSKIGKFRSQKESPSAALSLDESGEAEDGEILEDGELDDEEDVKTGGDSENQSNESSKKNKERVSPNKFPSKEDSRGEKNDRKRSSEHKDRDRKKKDEDKGSKRKKYMDMESNKGDSELSPTWGAGLVGSRQKDSKSQATKQLNRPKRENSPPGLYDSPSYSEDSEDDMSKMADGYGDTGADEKEGFYKYGDKLRGKKRHKKEYYENRKRGREYSNRKDGPPKKKLNDMNMSDRPMCKFFLEGKCAKGSGCQFHHDKPNKKMYRMEVCKYHLTVKGCHRDHCQYMHEEFPCKYYHTGQKCFSGNRCKFSHAPLTQDTRRALEARVSAEDIIDMEDPYYDDDYEDDYHEQDRRGRGSLLGSPPVYPRKDRGSGRKIPSLFDIEVHPPGHSPKPSPQPSRGYNYNDNMASSPDLSTDGRSGPSNSVSGTSMNSPGVGMNHSDHDPNQGLSNSNGQNISRTGLLNSQGNGQNLMNGPNGNIAGGQNTTNNMSNDSSLGGQNKGSNMLGQMGASNNQGSHPNMMGHSSSAPTQFVSPNSGQLNNGPVLNMLGAIIREAANTMSQGPMGFNSTNIPQNMMRNNGGPPNSMSISTGSSGMNNQSMISSNINQSMGSIGQGNMNHNVGSNGMNQNQGPGSLNQIMDVGNNMGSGISQNMGHGGMNTISSSANSMGQSSTSESQNNDQTVLGEMNKSVFSNFGGVSINSDLNQNRMSGAIKNDQKTKQEDSLAVDNDNTEEESHNLEIDETDEDMKDLSDLDKLRQQIQAQIDDEATEDEEGEEIEDGITTDKQRGQNSEKTDDSTTQAVIDEKAVLVAEVEAELAKMPIPSLPKKQRELFIRVKRQELLREKEILREKEKAKKDEAKIDETKLIVEQTDDWYSSDEEGEDQKPKLADVLKKLNSEPLPTNDSTAQASNVATTKSEVSELEITAATTTAMSAGSAFNIMQMINKIKKQSSSTVSSANLTTNTVSSSLASFSFGKNEDGSDKVPTFKLPTLTVEPPVTSARPLKPLTYAVRVFTVDFPKLYTVLPEEVDPSESRYKNDPRVKWHLQYLEKQLHSTPKEPERRPSGEVEKPVKVDPRLKKDPRPDPRSERRVEPRTDPRTEPRPDPRVDPRTESRVEPRSDPRVDPRLAKKDQTSVGPSDPRVDPRLQRAQGQPRVDPRLARAAASGSLDPRLNRQNSQPDSMTAQAGMMGTPLSPSMMSNSGGNMGMIGPMGNMGNLMPGINTPIQNMAGSMNNNNMGSGMNNVGRTLNSMSGPGHLNNQMCGPGSLNNHMVGPGIINQIGGPNLNNQMGNSGMNSQMGNPGMNNQMGNQGMNNQMGNPGMNNQMGNPGMNNQMGNPGMNNQMGNSGMNNQMGNSGMNIQMGNPGMNNPMSNSGMNLNLSNQMGGLGMNMMGASGMNNQLGGIGNSMNMMGGPINSRLNNHSFPGSVNSVISGNINRMNGPSNSLGNSMNAPMSGNSNINRMGVPSGPIGSTAGQRGIMGNSDSMDYGSSPDSRLSSGPKPQMDLRDPRSFDSRDPRSNSNDPRFRNKSLDSVNKNDPRSRRDPRLGQGKTDNNDCDIRTDEQNVSSNLRLGGSLHESRGESNQSNNFPNVRKTPIPEMQLHLADSRLHRSNTPPFPQPSSTPPPDAIQDFDSESKQKPTQNFDHRSDPRFKRVKRSVSQQKNSMEYSSPLGGADEKGDNNSSQYNNYNKPRLPNRDPRNRNVPSPTLPETLHDFDIQNSQSPVDEQNVNVKDVFKTLDPTASPFC